ncbi:ribonuclease H1 small subunit [Lindgomyces ingoldianus]|uniref:Ribonuclease H1 small subunit n=1 Tax=Lindgomyces ingoldianus TaxID=673940 RepID=A0ACB6QKY3_9PLEO|nr:ribonuclease H1 small subunit [Lindgomyces ingoldianus]KAF2467674.1 ribonuclease H1 small subunit [Lindgomyces ingoldianus]
MLAIQKASKPPQKCTPNLLPARLSHNGLVHDTDKYWKPVTESDKKMAYFRGRALHGTTLALPSNYTGAVLNITDKQLPTANSNRTIADDEDEDAHDQSARVEVSAIEQVGTFDEFVVWGHGGTVNESEDPYVRAVGEWIGFAESMHIDPEGKTDGEET